MRLLVLMQGHAASDHPGFHDGFNRLVREGVLTYYEAIPYWGFAAEFGWQALYQHAFERAQAIAADAIFLQFFHGEIPSPAQFIKRVKGIPSAPLVFSSCGDPFGQYAKRLPLSMIEASRFSDVSFYTGMGHIAQQAVAAGAKNVLLMPHGCCQVRFGSIDNARIEEPEYDIVFIGSRISSRNPFSPLFRSGRARLNMVTALQQRYGKRFALFGQNWEGFLSWRGSIKFDRQVDTYRKARLIIGGYPNVFADYYTSDRPFIAMTSGIPFLDQRVARIDRFFKDGEHWYLYDDFNSMIRLIDKLLDEDQSILRQQAETTTTLIREKHTQYHRVREMVEIVASLRDGRMKGNKVLPPVFSYFLPDIDQSSERKYSTFKWIS